MSVYKISNARYACDHDFFDTESEESFYLAGFVAADGCVRQRKNRSPMIRIELSSSDRKHVEKLKNILQAENPIYDLYRNRKYQNRNDTESSYIEIQSLKLCQALKRFNIVPRKTKTYNIPMWLMTHELNRHFLRGYFDGDGCIYKNKKYTSYGANVRGTLQFLESFKTIIGHFDIKSRNPYLAGGSYIMSFTTLNVGKLCSFLYKDSNIYLDRKRKLAQRILFHYFI